MDQFSLSVAKIQLFGKGDAKNVPRGLGTGFYYIHESTLFLVTNWHVVTGVDPYSLFVIDKEGIVPSTIIVSLKRKVFKDGRLHFSNVEVEVPLYDRGTPLWFEHSTRQNVDVAALKMPISAEDSDLANVAINSVDQEPRLTPYAGMDGFVLGFPEGMTGPGVTPIWKRGSIASEPQFNFRDMPAFLIDTATRDGMSGSPVIVRHSGYFQPEPSKVMTGTEILGTVEKFVGIYSGRIGDDPMGVQLGIVWRAEVLNDILTCATRGANPSA